MGEQEEWVKERAEANIQDRAQDRAKEILEAEEAIRKLATVIGSASERAREEEELRIRLNEATEALAQARESVESARQHLSGTEEVLQQKSNQLAENIQSVTTHLDAVREAVQRFLEENQQHLTDKLLSWNQEIQTQVETGTTKTGAQISELRQETERLLEGAKAQIEERLSKQLATAVTELKITVNEIGTQIGTVQTQTQKHFLRTGTLLRWVLMVAMVAGLLGAAITNMLLLK